MINQQFKNIKSKLASSIDDNGDGKIEMKDITSKSTKFAGEVWEKVTGYLLAAFGLVAGLAWNDAIKAIIAQYYPVSKDGYSAQLIYALMVTALVVIVSIIFVRLAKSSEKKEEDK